MDRNRYYQPTEEGEQLPLTEDEQPIPEGSFSQESSDAGPRDSSQRSSEYGSRTQLHPQSDLSIGASSRVLYDANVETLPERTSHGTTRRSNQDINLPHENLDFHAEGVVESGIHSQDVGASALERGISNEPLRGNTAVGEEAQGPHNEALDAAGPSGRPADQLQELTLKYFTEVRAIISEYSNFLQIVRLFTKNPKVLLGIIQIFIDNPEVLRPTSRDSELTLLQPDQLPHDQSGSSSGPSELHRNPRTAGGSTLPNPSQSLSDDLEPTGGDPNVHINLLAKFDELKEVLRRLQDQNDQEGVGDSALASQISRGRPLEDSLPSENESTLVRETSQSELMEDIRRRTLQVQAALKGSGQSEIEPPSRKGGGSSEEPQPGPSRRPSEYRRQSLVDKSNLPGTSDRSTIKDTVAEEKSQPSGLEFPSQEVRKSSELDESGPGGGGVIKWSFKPTHGTSSDIKSDSSISRHSASKDSKSEEHIHEVKKQPQDNQKYSAAPQRSEGSEIGFPSRKAEESGEEPQPVASRKPSDCRKQRSEDRSNLPAPPDENAPRHCKDRPSTKDSAFVKRSHQSESNFPPQEVEESGGEHQLQTGREGVIKWFFKPTGTRSSDVPAGPSSPQRRARKGGKSLAHIQTAKKKPQFSCHSNINQRDGSRRFSDNREHAPTLTRSDESEIEFSPRKVGEYCEEPRPGPSRRPSDHGKKSSEDRSSLPAAPEENVGQRCADRSSTKYSVAVQTSRQSELEFLPQEVGKSSRDKQPESSARSIPNQYTDFVTEQVVKWFFKLRDTTTSAVESNPSGSELPASEDVKLSKDTNKHKKKPQGPCRSASNQPGPRRKLSDNRDPAAALERSGKSGIDFPSRKLGEPGEEPQPGPSRKSSKRRKQISKGRRGLPKAPGENVEHRRADFSSDLRKQSLEDRSYLPAAPDANVKLQGADRYSTEDFADRQKSCESELEFSSKEVGGTSEEQRPERPSSPNTDLLTNEVVKWFFDLNNSIRLIVQNDLYSSENPASKDIKRTKEPQGPRHLTLAQSGSGRRLSEILEHAGTLEASGESEIEVPSQRPGGSSEEPQPGPSRRSSERREHISEGRSGLPKEPDENVEHRWADFYFPKESAATEKSSKSKSEFASQEVGEPSGEQQPGSKEGRFLCPSTHLLTGEVVHDSDPLVDKGFEGEATGQGLRPPTPEERPSPQLLNVGNVNELMGHLNAPPIPTIPCDVCHLRPMKFQELNFWCQLHWKLIIDGQERDFESQAKPIVLVNPNEADEYFQEIKSRMPDPSDDADTAHQKTHKYKKGRKEKKRNF